MVTLPLDMSEAGTECMVSGWGMEFQVFSANIRKVKNFLLQCLCPGRTCDSNGPVPNDLQYLEVTTITLEQCRAAHNESLGVLSCSNICTFTKAGEGMCRVIRFLKLKLRILLLCNLKFTFRETVVVPWWPSPVLSPIHKSVLLVGVQNSVHQVCQRSKLSSFCSNEIYLFIFCRIPRRIYKCRPFQGLDHFGHGLKSWINFPLTKKQ